MTSLWGHDLPFLTFIPAMVLSAWAGGFWAGLVTTLLGGGVVAYYWLPPAQSFRIASVGDLVGLLVFVAVGVLVSALSETMHPARRPLEALLPTIPGGFVVFAAQWG